MVACGDLSEDGSAKAYDHFEHLTSGLCREVIWLPGNHDRFDHLSQRQKKEFFRGEWHAGPWSMIFLDTTIPERDEGFLGNGELERLRVFLATHAARHIWIFMHHHPCRVGSEFIDALELKNSHDFWKVVSVHPAVRGVTFGHVHQPIKESIGGITCLSAPSAAMQFKPFAAELDFEDLPPGYIVLELHPDGCSKSLIERMRI